MAVQTIQIKADPRQELGSRANKKLRDTGLVPGVVYGHKKDVVPVKLNRKELSIHLARGAHVFDLSIDGLTETVLVKDVQYDYLSTGVMHVDFARVSKDEKVQVAVPLELKGTPKGEADGGKLQQIIANLQIECRVLEIPEFVRHSVADMELDSVLHIKDIKLPEGVRCLQDGELIAAMVREVQEVVLAAPVVEEGAAEPEVIGRKPGEEEEGAAEGAAPAAEKPEKK